ISVVCIIYYIYIYVHIFTYEEKVRVSGTEEIEEVIKYITGSLDQSKWHIELDTFYAPTPLGEKRFTNIIATFRGLHNGSLPNDARRVILSAHHDSKYFESGTFVGATDSATCCAM